MIRLRFVTLVAVAVVAGALSIIGTTRSAIWIFVVLTVLGIGYAMQTRHPRRNLIRMAIALSLFWPSYAIQKKVASDVTSRQLHADTASIAGIVHTSPVTQSNGGTTFELSVTSADNVILRDPIIIQVQLPDRREGPTPGQTVRVSGTIGAARSVLNPGEEHPGLPSPQLFLARDIQISDTRSLVSQWSRWTADARNLVEHRARGIMNYRAYGLIEELLLHRKIFGTTERHLFSATGTSHLLAISGLHLSLVFSMMTILFGLIFSERSIGHTLAPLLGTLCYLAFIDFPPSADRAFVMLCIVAFARLTGRHIGELASLSWAALVLTIIDPSSVFDIGLQLSFASVGGLFFIGGPLSRHVRVKNGVLRTVLTSLCSTVGASLPALALAIPTFHVFAPVALLANIVAIPAVSLLLPFFLIWTVLLLILRPLAALFAPVINLAATAFFGLLEVFSRFPGSHMNVSAPVPVTLASLGVFFVVIILVADNGVRFKAWRHAPVLLATALVLIAFVAGIVPADTRVTFPVVEQGNAMLVRDREIGTWFCLFNTDADAARRAIRTVGALGVNTIDSVIISGDPQDLPEQLDALFASVSPCHVWIPSNCVTGAVSGLESQFQQTIQTLSPDQTVQFSRGRSWIAVSGSNTSRHPAMLLSAGVLTGAAGTPATAVTGTSRFIYDLTSRVVTVTTPAGVSRFPLDQTGCITVFMRSSRCWVAPDPRR